MNQEKKRVLFLNPRKRNGFFSERIHMGATLLGQILSEAGCSVLIIDYSFLASIESKIKVPSIEEAIAEFCPDVVCIPVFTYLYDEVHETIERVSQATKAVIMVGGPHVTLFPEDFLNDRRVSYVVQGEAETVILELVREAKKEPSPVLVQSPPPPAEMIPAVNLDIALGSEHLREYQIQLSRGCPFNCSFCNVDLIASRRVRPRDLSQCIEQVIEAKRRYPAINCISITDDCPTFNKGRFKDFLSMLAQQELDCILTVDNMRADLIDDELLQRYIMAGGQNICLGVESGHTEVFSRVHKGESLDTISNAVQLIRTHGLNLGLCFVIGLPEDSFDRFKSSLALAKSLKPDYIYWNMCVPWPGTEVYDWFHKNGTIGEVRNFSTLIDGRLNFKDPPATTTSFPKEERIRAWLMANIETYNIPIFSLSNLGNLPSNIIRLFVLARRYSFYKSLPIMVWVFVSHKLWYELRRKYMFPPLISQNRSVKKRKA